MPSNCFNLSILHFKCRYLVAQLLKRIAFLNHVKNDSNLRTSYNDFVSFIASSSPNREWLGKVGKMISAQLFEEFQTAFNITLDISKTPKTLSNSICLFTPSKDIHVSLIDREKDIDSIMSLHQNQSLLEKIQKLCFKDNAEEYARFMLLLHTSRNTLPDLSWIKAIGQMIGNHPQIFREFQTAIGVSSREHNLSVIEESDTERSPFDFAQEKHGIENGIGSGCIRSSLFSSSSTIHCAERLSCNQIDDFEQKHSLFFTLLSEHLKNQKQYVLFLHYLQIPRSDFPDDQWIGFIFEFFLDGIKILKEMLPLMLGASCLYCMEGLDCSSSNWSGVYRVDNRNEPIDINHPLLKQVGLGFLEKNNQTTGIVKFAKFIQFLNQDDTQIDDMKWIEGIEMGLIDSGCWHLRQKFVELFQIVQLLKTDILYRDVRVTTECMDVLIPALEDWVNVASKYADQRVFIGAADVYYTELLQTGNRNFYSLDQDVWKKAEVVVLNRGLH